MAELWTRVQKTTITKYLKEQEINILQNQKLLALMQSKGRISFNHSGKKLNWRVKKARNSMTQYGDTQGVNFDRVNRHEEAEIDWRGYIMAESVTKLEKLANRGKEAIVNFVSELTDSMIDDIKYEFATELFLDGNAAGRENSIHGFQSWSGSTGTDAFKAPSDTYAGLSTVLGNYGGAVISGTWPSGKFDPEYYFWSPLLVDYDHNDFGASWAASCLDALRKGIIFSKNAKGKQGQMDVIIGTAVMYAEFLDQLDEKERIQVQRNGEKSGLVAMGFKDVVNYDGVDFTYEVDVPVGQAYGLNIDSLELCSMQGQLFVPGKDYDISTLSDQYTLDFFGNLKGNPRAFTLWDDF